MKQGIKTQITLLLIALLLAIAPSGFAQKKKNKKNDKEKAVPVFVDGEAQIVPGFDTPDTWIRHDLWVETEFDTDGDGKPDRMHVDVTRPTQTDTDSLKLPVIYISSPYFAGTASFSENIFWDVRHELGAVPPERNHPSGIKPGFHVDISLCILPHRVLGFLMGHLP